MARDVIRAYAQAGVSFEEEGQIIGKICCVVSLFNVFYLPELVDWAAKDFPGLRIFLSVLHQPEFFSIKNLPKPLKQTISAKLRSHSSVYNQPKASGLDRTFHDVDHFMMEEAESNMIAAALNEIDVRDRLRKEKFSEVFPELANVLF
jgi:hypothetical protein